MSAPPQIVSLTTVLSLSAVVAILGVAFVGSRALLPRGSSTRDQATFIWIAFDLLIHAQVTRTAIHSNPRLISFGRSIFEGSFVLLSLQKVPLSPLHAVNSSRSIFGSLWREYAIADSRWGIADPGVVSLEILTVFGAGPLCGWILWMLCRGDRARHYWIVVLSTAEIYGGWMTFVPEWLTGSQALNTSHPMYTWLYLFFFNFLWVIIPAWLMWDSFGEIALALREPKAYAALVAREDKVRGRSLEEKKLK